MVKDIKYVTRRFATNDSFGGFYKINKAIHALMNWLNQHDFNYKDIATMVIRKEL